MKLSKDEHEKILKAIADVGELNENLMNDIQRLRDDFSDREKDGGEFEEKYNELKKRYIDRFFTNPEEVKEETEKDVKRDGTVQTFDELFEKKEG